jgi:ketosteroid isomerase-like protein
LGWREGTGIRLRRFTMSAPAAASARETVDALFSALDALDTDAIAALLGDEPQGVDELSGGWRRGRDELDDYLAMLKQSGIVELRSTVTDSHLVEWADTALATIVLDQTYTLDGAAREVHAPTTVVLRREDGAWRVVLVHSVPTGDAG